MTATSCGSASSNRPYRYRPRPRAARPGCASDAPCVASRTWQMQQTGHRPNGGRGSVARPGGARGRDNRLDQFRPASSRNSRIHPNPAAAERRGAFPKRGEKLHFKLLPSHKNSRNLQCYINDGKFLIVSVVEATCSPETGLSATPFEKGQVASFPKITTFWNGPERREGATPLTTW